MYLEIIMYELNNFKSFFEKFCKIEIIEKLQKLLKFLL